MPSLKGTTNKWPLCLCPELQLTSEGRAAEIRAENHEAALERVNEEEEEEKV